MASRRQLFKVFQPDVNHQELQRNKWMEAVRSLWTLLDPEPFEACPVSNITDRVSAALRSQPDNPIPSNPVISMLWQRRGEGGGTDHRQTICTAIIRYPVVTRQSSELFKLSTYQKPL